MSGWSWLDAMERPVFWARYFQWRLAPAGDADVDRLEEDIFGVSLERRDSFDDPFTADLYGFQAERWRHEHRAAAAVASPADMADALLAAITGADLPSGPPPPSEPAPPLDLPLGGQYVWRIAFHPWPAIEHTLAHPSRPEPLRMGLVGVQPRFPWLRWTEALSLAERARQHAPHGPRTELLFWLGCSGAPGDSHLESTLVDATRRAGVVRPGAEARFVESLLRDVETEWSQDATLGWVTEVGCASMRAPDGERFAPHSGWRRDDHVFFAEAMRSLRIDP